MREDLDLVAEAASGQTVYLMPSGLFIAPKDSDSLGAWLRDLCRILEAEGVSAIRCGGFCAGGLAALLFAKEFLGRGGTVEELVVVDAYGSEWARWLGRNVFGKLRFRSRFRAGWDRLRGRTPEPSRESSPVESPLDFDRVPYDGPTVLAMASQNRSRRWIIPRWGWTDPTHRAWRIVVLPGTHLGIFEPPTRRQLLELLWGNKSD
ncbi:MAG TPA: hypothetical protein VMF06_02835, partial [Candidatus Limnocylindria bacterium]|nr:hypothetical protein [Candidatus Limnocylindria bacterium]